jgi:hypothetical protein
MPFSFMKWISGLRSPRRNPIATRKRQSFQPLLEQLERRDVPTINVSVLQGLTAPVGQPLNNSPVATFQDPTGGTSANPFQAAIEWGDGGSSSGTIQPGSNGTDTVLGTYTYAAPGSFPLSVTVTGNGDSGSDTQTIVVNTGSGTTGSGPGGPTGGGDAVGQPAVSVSVTSSANPAVFGQTVTFTATVMGNIPGGATPTGTVQFFVDGAPFGDPVSLSGGSAAMQDALDVGGHTVTAAYSGDRNFSACTSTGFSQTVNPNVTIVAIPDQSNQEGDAVSLTVDGTEDPTGSLSYTASGLPAGLSIDAGGTISGTIAAGAAAASPYSVTVTAGDGTFSASQSFAWAVAPTMLLNPGDQSSVEGTTITLSTASPSFSSATVAYSADGLPPGLSIDNSSGVISGTIAPGAAQNGPYEVSVSASDGGDPTAQWFTWTVTPRVALAAPLDQYNEEGDNPILPLNASDAAGIPLSYRAAGLPAGLSIDPSAGTISGSIATGAAATAPYTVTVTASEGPFSATQTFSWTVTPGLLLNPGDQSSVEGDAVSLPLAAASSAGASLTFLADGLPSGLSIDPVSGVISGTVAPGAGQTSPQQVTVFATNGALTARRSFAWDVSPRVSLDAPSPQTNYEGNAVTLAVTATDQAGIPVTYSAAGLPPGLAIDPTSGLISGIIAAGAASNQPYSVDLTATEGAFSASQTFTWLINQRVSLTQPGHQANQEGDAVRLALVASDSLGNPLTYSAEGLPAGLTLDGVMGVISGTIAPGSASGGPYAVTATAAEGPYSATQTFTWTVSQGAVLNPGDQVSTEGDTISLSVAGSGSPGSSMAYSAVALPAGLSIDSATGLVSGDITAGAAQNSPYHVIVSASSGTTSTSQSFVWTVTARVTLTAPGDQSNQEGDNVSLPINATDNAGQPLTYSASGLPAGLTIDPATGLISGTIAAVAAVNGPYTVTVGAADGAFNASTQFAWTVSAAASSSTSAASSENPGIPANFTGTVPPAGEAASTQSGTNPSSPVFSDTWHEHYTVTAESAAATYYLDVDITGSSSPGPAGSNGSPGPNILSGTFTFTLRLTEFGSTVVDVEDGCGSFSVTDVLQLINDLPPQSPPDGYAWVDQSWDHSYTDDATGTYLDQNGQLYSFASHVSNTDWWNLTDSSPLPGDPGQTVTEDITAGGTWLSDVTCTDLNATVPPTPGYDAQGYPTNMFAAAPAGTSFLERSFDTGSYDGNSHATYLDGSVETLAEHTAYTGNNAYRYFSSNTEAWGDPNRPSGVAPDQFTWLIDYQGKGAYSGSEDMSQDQTTGSLVYSDTTKTENSGQVLSDLYDFGQVYHRNDGTVRLDGTYHYDSNNAPGSYDNLEVHALSSDGTQKTLDTLTYVYYADGASDVTVSDNATYTVQLKNRDGSLAGTISGSRALASGSTTSGSSLETGTTDQLAGTSSVVGSAGYGGSGWDVSSVETTFNGADGSTGTGSSFYFASGSFSANASVNGDFSLDGKQIDGTSFAQAQDAGAVFESDGSTMQPKTGPVITGAHTLNGGYSDSGTADLSYNADGTANGTLFATSSDSSTEDTSTGVVGVNLLNNGIATFKDARRQHQIVQTSLSSAVVLTADVPAGMSNQKSTDTLTDVFTLSQTLDRNPDVVHARTWAIGVTISSTTETLDAYLGGGQVTADRTIDARQVGASMAGSTGNGKTSDPAGHTGSWNATSDGWTTVNDEFKVTSSFDGSGWKETARWFSINEHSRGNGHLDEQDNGVGEPATALGQTQKYVHTFNADTNAQSDYVLKGTPDTYAFDIYVESSKTTKDHMCSGEQRRNDPGRNRNKAWLQPVHSLAALERPVDPGHTGLGSDSRTRVRTEG